jgi:hypothetical protein
MSLATNDLLLFPVNMKCRPRFWVESNQTKSSLFVAGGRQLESKRMGKYLESKMQGGNV